MRKPLFFRRPFKYVYFHATLAIIVINFLVFLLTQFVMPRITGYLAMSPIGIVGYKMFYQFVTYMFVHGNFQHIFFNMLGLLFFGVALEKAMGSWEFLLFYFLTGILSGVLSFAVYWFTGQYLTMLIGASGAVYAVLFAYAVGFPKSRIFIWGIIPVPAPILVLAYTVIEVVSEIFGNSNVAHLTHLFGFLIAYIYFLIRMGIHPIKVWIEALKK